MLKLSVAPVFITIVLLLSSCSSVDKCSKNGNYNVEYYSGGGFTGIEKGIVIKCNGSAVTWTRQPGRSRQYGDTLKLSDKQLEDFNKSMESQDLLTYENTYTGNYTIHLNIIKNDKINKISFNGSELPAGMPEAVTNLIAEIKSIYKQ